MLPRLSLTLILAGAFASSSFVGAEASDKVVQQIVTLLRNPDREFRAAALEAIRSGAKGAGQTQTFAAQVPMLEGALQAELIAALGDRGDVNARPAVIEQLKNKDETVRAAALAALGGFSDPADLPVLIKALSSNSEIEQREARGALIRMRNETVNRSIAVELNMAAPSVRGKLIEVLAVRRANRELPAIIAATTDADGGVRSAAMKALGNIGRPEQVAAMLPGVLKAAPGSEREAAEQSVSEVCRRIENEDQRGDALIAALNTVDADKRDELISLVGRVGGRRLIAYVAAIATDERASRRAFGIDALGKWPDSSPADILLDVASKTTDARERQRAFAAYVKVSAIRDRRSDQERLERMKQAMKEARTTEEKSIVINRIRTAYDVEAMRFVRQYLDQPEFRAIACETIVELAHHRQIRDPHKAEFDKVLDDVIKNTKNEELVERANRYKRGETWERKK